PAAGTFESGVIRTVTTLTQSVELYGEPSFLVDSNGVSLHGDARNEYGLFALNQFLGVGNRAFVVRADVNLDDDLDNIRTIWDSKFVSASTLLTTLVIAFLTEWNESRGLVSTDALFRASVTEAEFLSLAATATADVWAFSSFSNSEDNYFDDQTLPAAATSGSQTANFAGRIDQGQQIINFTDYLNAPSQTVDIDNGFIDQFPGSPETATNLTGGGSPLVSERYGFRVTLDNALGSPLGAQQIVLNGTSILTYTTLITEINAQLTGAVVDVVSGNLRFTRTSTGTSAAINIEDGVTAAAGSPQVLPLFANLPDFVAINTATTGGGNSTGLENDSTSYSIVINVDAAAGSPAEQTLSVQGQNAQTYTKLVTALNAQLTGATIAITSDGNILVWSDLVSATTSSIAITNAPAGSPLAGNLLPNLRSVVAGAGSPLIALDAPTVSDPTVSEGNPTGLANTAAVFSASFVVDGTPRAIQFAGLSAQTYGDLLDLINIDLGNTGSPRAGGVAIATIVAGNIVVTSASTGTASTIAITDSNLFSSLGFFVSLLTSVAGTGVDSSLLVFANGYDQASTGTFDGLEGIAALWFANSLGTVPGEWTSTEAADTILAASDDYKFTVEFRSETSLGANDTVRRTTIVTALQGSVNSNTEVLSTSFEYNLVLVPGYHELADELLALTVNLEQEVFVIADTPMDMTPTEVVAWASTSARQQSESVAYYYPHALASNLNGVNVVGAASGVALRTYAVSDNQSELWFAPAGTRRGLVSGVTQVGYVAASNVFTETNLNKGQREDLYKYFTNINPIVFFQGRGLVVWGQKTSASTAGARDRVNVERLVAFVRRSLRKSLLPFVFEPNDALTRDSVKASVDNFLGDLVVRRGLFDFATVVDESNNTPDRIDRNELWVDVALQPVKAAEFIIVPIRIVATGTEI
ncbi:hypothetical protein LCGC14_1643070, partial [marine sediment metagenome]